MKRPKLRRRKSDRVYYARLYVNSRRDGGKRRREVLTFGTDKVTATALLDAAIAKRSARISRGASGEPITFGTLAAMYLEAERGGGRERATIEKLLIPAFGSRRVDRLTAADWRAFQRERTKKGVTWGRDFTTFRAILNFGESEELIERNPIRRGAIKFEREVARLVYFSPEEWKSLLAAFDDETGFRSYVEKVRKFGRISGAGRRPDSEATTEHYERFQEARAVLEGLLLTFSRLGEIVGLTWQDVDLKNERLTVPQFKTGAAKVIPIGPELRALLMSRERGTGAAPVFRRSSGNPFAKKDVQRAFALAKKLSGVRAELTPHSIRHTGASWLVASGASLYAVSKLLGHADVRMTTRYAHLAPEHLREAAAVIGRITKEATCITAV